MKTKFYLSLVLAIALISLQYTIAQTNIFPSTGSVGIGTTMPNSSSILEVKSTTKGMLVPRMTKIQRDAIASPTEGLLIYQTNNTPGLYYYEGGWAAVAPKNASKLLNNLIAPTAVNVDLLPGANNAINLGSTSFAWKNIYCTGSLYSGGNRLLSADVSANTFLGITSGNTGSTGSFNTAIGYQTMFLNTTGYNNTALGSDVLYSNSTGYNNTGSGYYALSQNTIGNNNTATGANALTNNTIGAYNSATGYGALSTNTTGYFNTANGSSSLYKNSDGNFNTASGYYSLYSNTTGAYNTAIGEEALEVNSTGYYNTATGAQALSSNSTGSTNTANGYQVLYKNTTGNFNTATGGTAMYYNSTGEQNTVAGFDALYYNTLGSYNVADGFAALETNSYGSYNTAIGWQALSYNTTGSFNTALGYFSGGGNINNIEATSLGYNTVATASYQVRIGSPNVTSIGGYAGWSNISDGRYKKNIKENVPGLEFINQLKPVTYNLDITAINAHMDELRPEVKSPGGKITPRAIEDKSAAQEKEKILYTGFIAQDVEATAKKMGYDFSGVDAPKNDKGLYGLRYSDFVVPLVKAVQELSSKNDELKKQNDIQNKINESLQRQIDDLKTMVATGKTSGAAIISDQQKTINLTNASLEQNTPNPFAGTTTIHYTLPQKFSSAQIIITDKSGKVLKQLNITGAGKGSLNVDAAMLSSGAYNYSLYVDGKLTGSKQMVLSK